jgi:uroporphyrinogen-III decarboxylase
MAAMAREKTDRIPLSLWAHVGALPYIGSSYEAMCKDGNELANVHLKFFRKFPMDLLKVTTFTRASCAAWGCRHEFHPGSEWFDVTRYAVEEKEDWESLRVLDPAKAFAEDLKGARILKEELSESVPFVWSTMGVLFVACGLAGDDLVLSGVRSDSPSLKKGLDIITDSLTLFCEAVVDAGADGIFYALRPGTERDLWNELTGPELEEYSFKYDLKVLKAIRDAKIRILHICTGHKRKERYEHLMTLMKGGELARFPVDAINWWDRSFFDLRTAKGVYGEKFCLMGGLDQEDTMPKGSPEDVERQVADAVDAAGRGEGFMVAPGCTIRSNAPEENFAAAIAATQKYGST